MVRWSGLNSSFTFLKETLKRSFHWSLWMWKVLMMNSDRLLWRIRPVWRWWWSLYHFSARHRYDRFSLNMCNIWRNTHFSIIENCYHSSLRFFFLCLWIPKATWVFGIIRRSRKKTKFQVAMFLHLHVHVVRRRRIDYYDFVFGLIYLYVFVFMFVFVFVLRWKTEHGVYNGDVSLGHRLNTACFLFDSLTWKMLFQFLYYATSSWIFFFFNWFDRRKKVYFIF